MLKIHRVRAGGHGYYLEGREVGTDIEEPGVWVGAAAASLGLVGEVAPTSFTSVMAGRHPQTDQVLRRVQRPNGVEGFDLTFCAPKSVSLLQALAPSEIADAAGAGHHRAVADAATYLARHGLGVCRSAGGERRFLPSTGLVGGEFRHQVSRALDPHLHTHLVAANVARGPDGAWSAVDGRRLYAHLRAAGTIYHSRLRLELAENLGAAWEVRSSGLGDVVGVDRGLRRLFSQRSAAIDEYVAIRPSGRLGAALATRPDKAFDRSSESLRTSWTQRAADFGFDLAELSRVVGRGRWTGDQWPPGRPDPGRLADSLADSNRPLARRDLVAAVAAASVGGAAEAVVDKVVDRIAESLPSDSSLSRAREPRWRAGDVVTLVLRRGDSLVPDSTLSMAGDRPSNHREHPIGQARDRRSGRSVSPGRARENGMDLGR